MTNCFISINVSSRHLTNTKHISTIKFSRYFYIGDPLVPYGNHPWQVAGILYMQLYALGRDAPTT